MSDVVDKFDTMREIMMGRLAIHRSYRAVFGTDEGGRVLRHILREGFATRTTFVAGDPEQTMLNEGSRRLALSILRMAKVSSDERIRQIEQELQL